MTVGCSFIGFHGDSQSGKECSPGVDGNYEAEDRISYCYSVMCVTI